MSSKCNFLDLPPELRKSTYESLFIGCKIDIEATLDQRAYRHKSTRPPIRKLPGVLPALKLIRAELLPIFHRLATNMAIHHHDPFPLSDLIPSSHTNDFPPDMNFADHQELEMLGA